MKANDDLRQEVFVFLTGYRDGKKVKENFAFVLLSLMVFVYACDQMGGSKQGKGQSKTLKNTQKKGSRKKEDAIVWRSMKIDENL